MIKSILMFICYYIPWTVGVLIIAGTICSIISSFNSSNDVIEDDISEEDDYEE